MIKTIDVSAPSVAEEIRKKMSEATLTEKGLIGAGRVANAINGRILSNVDDANLLYQVFPQGMTVCRSNYDVPNMLNTGMLIHLQRYPKLDVSGSQFIIQIGFRKDGIYVRKGTGNGTMIIYGDWSLLATLT